MGYKFGALRPGETERVCAKCGAAYMPQSRMQKYCPGCGVNRTAREHRPRKQVQTGGTK